MLPSFKSLKEIGTYKGLAKIGDAITNLIYSIAKSKAIGHLDARSVSRTILSQALKNAGLRDYAKQRADSHDLADTAEAFIGYSFCAEICTLDQLVSWLGEKFTYNSFIDEKQEILSAIDAFSELLEKIKVLITPLCHE